MVRGVSHAEYIKSHDGGRYYFLEVAARVGGAFIAELVENSTGLNLWAEWARIEVSNLRGVPYVLPEAKIHLRGQRPLPRPHRRSRHLQLRSAGDRPPHQKPHHAGLIVQSPDPERVASLLDEYSHRFAEMYLAIAPVPDKPTN